MKQKYNHTRRLGAAALGFLLAMQTACTNDNNLASRVEGSPFCNTTGSNPEELKKTTKNGKWGALNFILKIARPGQLNEEVFNNIVNNSSLGKQKAKALKNMIAKMFAGKLSAKKKAKYLATVVAGVMPSKLTDDEKLAVIKSINDLILPSKIQPEKKLGSALVNIAAYIEQHGQQIKGSIPSLNQFAEALLEGTLIKNDGSNKNLVLQNSQMAEDVILVCDHLLKKYKAGLSEHVVGRIFQETGLSRKEKFEKARSQQNRKPKKFRGRVGYSRQKHRQGN